jgi:hypothetical protein
VGDDLQSNIVVAVVYHAHRPRGGLLQKIHPWPVTLHGSLQRSGQNRHMVRSDFSYTITERMFP